MGELGRDRIVVVLNNLDLNQVTWEQRVMSGDPKLEASQTLPEFPFARYAELLGLEGVRIEAPDQVAPGLDRAFAARGPVVVEAMTDPEVPPLPPHIELEQGRRLTSAIRRRDPALRDIIRNSIKGKAAELRNR